MTRRRVCIWLLVISCSLSAAVVLARPGVVKTLDGQTYSGEVDEKDPATVVVTVRGIQSRLPRARIATIEYPDDFEKEFADRLAKLGPRDVAGRLALAREAFDGRKYALARVAAESARQIDPNSADAAAMLETIQSQLRLERAKVQAAETPATMATTEPATQPGEEKLLKPADINAIRLAELRETDTVRYRFERDVNRRYMRYANIQASEWNSLSAMQQIAQIVSKGTPEMRRDVHILSDPPSLFQYRRMIQPFVIQGCATSGCHGGANAQKFCLIQPAESDAASFTNFYILEQYTKSLKTSGNAVFGRGVLKMIDRQSPEQSMLLQYALPGSLAEYDHPDVQNFRPALRGPTDPRYRQILDWIGTTLTPIDPDYGIGSTAATQPATTQSSTTQAAAEPAARPIR